MTVFGVWELFHAVIFPTIVTALSMCAVKADNSVLSMILHKSACLEESQSHFSAFLLSRSTSLILCAMVCACIKGGIPNRFEKDINKYTLQIADRNWTRFELQAIFI